MFTTVSWLVSYQYTYNIWPFSHAWYWSNGKEATYHNDILVASIHSCKQQPLFCIVCIRVCLIPYIWFLIRILELENATLMGPRKEAKDSRKICERGVPGNFYLAQPPYIYIWPTKRNRTTQMVHTISVSFHFSMWKWMMNLARLQQSQDVVRRWSMLHLWCFSQWLLDILMAHGLVVWSFTLGWGFTRPPKLTCPQENLQWLEDSFPFEMAPFWGEMLVFCTYLHVFFRMGFLLAFLLEQELLVHSPIMQKQWLVDLTRDAKHWVN